MKRLKYYFFPLVLSYLCLNCSDKKKSYEIWMGAGSYYKDAIEFPNPIILNYSQKKLLNINSKKEISFSSIDTLKIKGNNFLLNYKKNNTLMYRSVKDTNITLLFHKAIKVPKIKSFNDLYENVWEEKINKSKESIDFIIENTFDTNKWLLSRKYILNGNDFFLENEKYDIDTLSYHGYKFLIQEGKKYLRIYQLTKLTEKELSFISNDSFYSYQKRLISTRRNKRGIDSDSSFSICNEHQIGEYYYGNRGTRYKGGKRFLSEYFLEKYSSPIDSSQNGYVRIRFVVNCNGKTGRYSIQETDVHFKEVKFNPEIVSQLFLLTKDLKEWIPNSSYRKEVIDTYKHLTFKIKNGQIKEILP